MYKKYYFLVLVASLGVASGAQGAAHPYHKQSSNLMADLITVVGVAGASYIGWQVWDWWSRYDQVKADRAFLAKVYHYLLNMPPQHVLESPNFGRVNPHQPIRLFWLNWRVSDNLSNMGSGVSQVSWKTFTELLAAAGDAVVNQLLTDKRQGKILCLGRGLTEAQLQSLRTNYEGLGLVYYDIRVELMALKKILIHQLSEIVQFSKPDIMNSKISSSFNNSDIPKFNFIHHFKQVGGTYHKGLESTLLYLRECSPDQLMAIKAAFMKQIPVDGLKSWWYQTELDNCRYARNYFWDLLLKYIRLYTLSELVQARLGGNYVYLEPNQVLFVDEGSLPPYQFGRKDVWSDSSWIARNQRDELAIPLS